MILCDTGPLVAVLNSDDADHKRCLEFLERCRGPLIVPAPVLTEVCWLLESRVGPAVEASFLRSVADEELRLEALTLQDLSRMAELVTSYADFPLGTVDASVIAVAERLGVRDVATLDYRHFRVVRPRHVNGLALHP
ncbi:type II toxin-antitoxin system VapC family toxin [Sphaerisporangium melleum]|uniref:type II toxin-antitoxin system VapC family toxin n=1 Tax=Sphaerisporangium melleum TaxID=321316 RepID=UPI00166512DC|nr:PIN domain-containing protein [Sphaerisporangium melleum]